MKVKATKLGYFGGRRVRVGDEFDCPSSLFSKNWMEKLSKPSKKKEEKVKEEPKKEDVLQADTFAEIQAIQKGE